MSTQSAFNPDSFMSQTFTETNSTKREPVPAGEYLAIAEKAEILPWAKKDGSASGVKLSIQWDIDDPSLKEALGLTSIKQKQDIMLDLTPDGGLDMAKGRNVGLGRLREALGLNVPGQPFAFPMIVGRMGKINVTQRIEGEDIFNDVKGVVAA